ncbi:mitochondrial coenzyme A diphosphatase NUDT8-like [Choristoneura fumiferana]|uniref:mitochondrial coenzyme A diphosphatase NUDT8-like n=1 Tax=Choristoneura fumiferana TaxID=7141 RepID=UPI003D155F86
MTNLKKMPLPQRRGKVPSATAAVLIPFCDVNDTASLLYTVRSGNLRSHSGQISFPGGKTDNNESSLQTALRETHEEIGLTPMRVDVWGQGPAVPGRDNSIMITPVVGAISLLKPEDLNVNTKEVAEVFTVPLETLCDKNNQYYTQFSNGYILPVFVAADKKIWGLTAFLTHAFLSSLLSKDIYRNEWMKRKIVIENSQG